MPIYQKSKSIPSPAEALYVIHELRTLRLLSLLGGVLAPVISIVWDSTYPDLEANASLGWLFSGLFLSVFVNSYFSLFLKKHVVWFSYSIFFAASVSGLYFAAVNQFAEGYTILFLLTIFSIALVFRSIRDLLIYEGAMLFLVMVALYRSWGEHIHTVIILLSLMFFFIVSFLLLTMKLELLASLNRSESKIRQMAYTDGLTGLPNRVALYDYLEQKIMIERNSSEVLSLLYLDLDNFKQINDQYGHQAGDQVLLEATDRIRQTIRSTDLMARLGGDEFAIAVQGAAHARASEIAHSILELFELPFTINGEPVHASISIGISLYPEHGINSDELISKADQAMYLAKKQGKNQCLTAQ